MKKFIPGKLFACPGSFSKALIFMKISFVLLFGFCLQTAAKGYSQGDVKITLELNGVKLSKALSVIEEKSGYRILYSNDDLPASRIVHIQAREELLSAVLDKLLADANLQYKIFDNTRAIVISSAVQKPDAVIHISGKVTDVGGNPLAGVTIKVKDTQLGTVTDAQGAFDLRFPDDVSSVVVFSYVGFQTREIKVKDGQKLHVVLEQAASGLDEVIVLGYGRQKKVSLTAAVASIGGNELVKAPVANISNTLGGRVAGIISRQANGAPGEDNDRIQIRGIGTTGNSAPLVVVNGIPMSYNQLNPNEIETVTILKDAAAVAPYGLAGANGVILITTKRGTTGKPVIRYNAYVGLENIAHMLEPLSPEEYVQKYADYLKQRNLPQTKVLENQYEIDNYNAGRVTDWIDLATQQGIIQDHNVSISGGTKDVRYYISGDYMKQLGVVRGYQYNRFSLRTNLDINITDYLTAGTNLFITNNNYDGGRANFYFAAAMSPYGTVHNATGAYEIYPAYPELLYTNPLLGLYNDRIDRSRNLNGNVYAELKPGFLEGLKYRVNASYTYIPVRRGNYQGRNANNTIGSASLETAETNSWIVENILTYTKDWDRHHIDFTGLYSAQERNYFSSNASATGFINDELSFYNLGAGSTQSAGSYRDRYSLVSQMARINYNYNGKYLLTLTARRDGSSVFGAKTDKYAVFPSVAVGWNISRENFMEPVSFVNNLKIRASYGKSGNEAINVYGTVTRSRTVRFPFSGVSTIGVVANNLGNESLLWETTNGLNIGVDFALLNSRVSGSIDYYATETKDILLSRRLPIITGYSSVLDNLGRTRNRGIDIVLNTVNVKTRDFTWESNINFSSNKNILVSLYGDGKNDVGNRWFLGHPIRVIYDYTLVGVWQVGEDPSEWDPGAQPGDLKFADINGDKKITADDKSVLGQQNPKWIGGFTNTFHYKNFHLNIFIQTIQGAMKNNVTLTFADEAGRMNTPKAVGYWTEENRSNTRPSLAYTNSRGYGYPSDNSYTRIKDVTLSYTFPQEQADRLGLGSLTLYLSGRNLYTFTNWIGWDPEYNYSFRGSGDWTNNYPNTRTIVLGANVTLR